MKITVANGKGGVGKTTVCVLLAHALAEAGNYRVGLIDRDPQATATDWIKEDTKTPVRIIENGAALTDYDAIVIDTPPLVTSPALLRSVEEADIVLLVSSPSPADLKTTVRTAELFKNHLKKGAKARILFNQVQPNTILGRTLDDKPEFIGIPALKALIQRRQAYQQAPILGCASIGEKARTELLEVALEVVGVFHKTD